MEEEEDELEIGNDTRKSYKDEMLEKCGGEKEDENNPQDREESADENQQDEEVNSEFKEEKQEQSSENRLDIESADSEKREGDETRKIKETEKKQNEQIKWAVFLMLSILLIIIVVPFITKNYINKFDYKGLEFQKTRIGELTFYSTRFPIVSGTGQVIGDYAVNLRNDPRDLEYIEVNITNDTLRFARSSRGYETVYISIDTGMNVCNESVIALATLSGFLTDAGLKVKSAVYNKSYAEENNVTFKNCWDANLNTIIKVRSSNKTYINELTDNCYEIVFKDCEIMQAVEKFELIILEEYASQFTQEKDDAPEKINI